MCSTKKINEGSQHDRIHVCEREEWLQGAALKKVQNFKYLGQQSRKCGKEGKKHVQACWNGWRKVSEGVETPSKYFYFCS